MLENSLPPSLFLLFLTDQEGDWEPPHGGVQQGGLFGSGRGCVMLHGAADAQEAPRAYYAEQGPGLWGQYIQLLKW